MTAFVWKDQFIAAGVDGLNQWKKITIAKELEAAIKDKAHAHQLQNEHFERAMQHVLHVRQFLSNPETILGSTRTKHGEVAEQMEVHIRNAWAALTGKSSVATFDQVRRTAPEDFLLNGLKFQSKFINGTNNTLSHVLSHFSKYQDQTMHYMIPKDQYEIIEAIRSGNPPGHLSAKTVQAILKKVQEIEQRTGRSFQDLVKPSISNYGDVQLGKAGETVSNHQDKLIDENEQIKNQIDEEAKRKQQSIEAKQGPSFKEGAKTAGAAAAISAALNTMTIMYTKIKSGKKIQNFDAEDWKEIGLSSAKAGAKGGLTAGSIYALTNLTSLSAPFAGAVTSAAMGLTSLMTDLQTDQITMDEFVTEGQILCIEAGIASIGGAIGTMLIPVPVLGSIIGTVTANFIWGFAKDKLGEKELELKKQLDAYTDSILAKIDSAYQDIIAKIDATYAQYTSLIEAAFDKNANTAVLAAASVNLAVAVDVEESRILKNDEELDAFFLN